MTIKLTHGSLFTGVGGFDMGAELAGVETKWQCEIDKNPTKVLERKWPKVTRYTDVCKVKGNEIDPVDIISFGSPCQDLSVAGKRAGLTGSRSSLYHEAIRITKEMRDATNNQYPRFIIWENVRGALSSNAGRDFNTAIQEMAKLGAMDISYRLVNACRFGVPQRRVRVFLIADLDGLCAGKILTESEGLLWHPTQNESKGQEVTSETRESIEGTSKEVYVKSSRAQSATGYETWKDGVVSPTLNLGDNTGDIRATILSVHAIQGNVIGRQDKNGPDGKAVKEDGEVMYTLTSTDQHAVGLVNEPIVYENKAMLDENWDESTIGNTLRSGRTPESIVFMPHMTDGARIQDKTMGTLVSTMGTGGNNVPMVASEDKPIVFSHNQGLDPQPSEIVSPTLRAGGSGMAVSKKKTKTTYSVRRLTPVECERLMGWPDNHTELDKDGNIISDSARYKMIGNGIVSPVAQWVCTNIIKALEEEKHEATN